MKEFDEINEGEYKIFGYWRAPRLLQVINNPFAFMIFYCLFAVVTSCLQTGVTVVNTRELENRFDLSISDSAFIASGSNIAFCALVIFVSYFGERYNKALTIAVSCGVFGLGAFIYALPHFTTGLHELASDRFQLKCLPEWRPDCEVKPELRYTMYLLFAGQFLMGSALTIFYTLGFTYLEQSVPKGSTSIYFSQIYVFINTGATIGILGSIGIFQNVYTDFDKTEPEIPQWDSRWVGAWWLFPLVCMAVSFILITIFAGYPKYLKGASMHYHRRSTEMYDIGSEYKDSEQFPCNFKGFTRGMYCLLRNPTFIFLTLAGCLQNLLLTGVGSFLAKHYEGSLNMTAEASGYIFGFLFALGTILGSFVGGVIVLVFKWKVVGIMKFCGAAMFLVAALSPGYLLYCDNIPVAGVTVNYGSQDDFTRPQEVNITSSCNEHCLCQEENYIPVCGSDNITYISPCHGGCPNVVAPYTYGRCECVKENFPSDEMARYTTVVDSCGVECDLKFYSLLATLLIIFFISFLFSPMMVATLRLVPNRLKSMSLGFQVFLYRCLGVIPATELFTAVLAPACLLWQKDMCSGKQGKCNIFDNTHMSNSMMLITLYGSLIAVVFIMAAIYFYKPVSISKNDVVEMVRSKRQNTVEESEIYTDDDKQSDVSSITRL